MIHGEKISRRTERVRVAVYAPDLLAGLGTTSILGADDRLDVLPDTDLGAAEVIVTVGDSIGDGVFAFLRQVRAASSLATPPRCVIVTDHFPVQVLMTAIECGMAALLPRRELDGEHLVRTILAVSQGAGALPPRLQGSLLSQLERIQEDLLVPNGLALSGLSDREREVLRLLADGHGTEEIAVKLAYSESTVKNVLHRVMSRYGLHNRTHAVAFALRTGSI
ncbi:DNA-binding response regulator, NarL/FixJ family, contains REC and HTH domains [Amycolatopsis lurida]|uniref:LuxR family transcriptional regulator n=1 Tax=Amycolatopsis lurida NRRL 2430 TaxID=1460371 RepID=A0A2P2FFV2_AMYLU|nr:response regulator transcription factor [Amycolatopsis lurida]KFU75595.1 LuxR family transcriptional regulator [Amycolatopsis lurida NRRL 2430]SEE56795.1 DNA-binding response regulator, NarL/FixJ family, contains REC and HTH domains [Amycolatopsis lurida]